MPNAVRGNGPTISFSIRVELFSILLASQSTSILMFEKGVVPVNHIGRCKERMKFWLQRHYVSHADSGEKADVLQENQH